MKKIFKIAFASIFALSMAPSIAISMTSNKEEVVSAEDKMVSAQNVYYFEGSSSGSDKKDFRNAPEGYTFNNGVITVTNAATVDYSIYVDDEYNKGNLTVVFEKDYGDGTIYIAGNGGEITFTSSIDVTVTLATIRNENRAVTIRGNVYLNIVGPEDRNILFNALVYVGHDLSILDNASFVCVDPKLYEKQFDKSYRLIFVDHSVNINTTGYFRVGIFETGSENTCPIIIYFNQESGLFNPNKCNGGAVIYTRYDPYKMYPASIYSTAYSHYEVINEEDGDREIYTFRKCIISYNSNGGTGEMESLEEYKHVSSYKLPACSFIAPIGQTFKCWAKNNVTGTQYNVGDSYDIDGDVTFYAIWEDDGTEYSITVVSGISDIYNAVSGTVVTITANVRDGYVFDKWVSSDDVTFEDKYDEKTTFVMINKDVTVTATYKVAPTPSKRGYNNLSGGAVFGIVVGSVILASIGAFSIYWFAIKKKTWAEFTAIFKKKK